MLKHVLAIGWTSVCVARLELARVQRFQKGPLIPLQANSAFHPHGVD